MANQTKKNVENEEVSSNRPTRKQRRSNSKQCGNNKRSKGRKDAVDQAMGKATNDISWYNKFPNLVTDAARIPFNVIAGTPLNWHHDNGVYITEGPDNNASSYVDHVAMPGVVALATSLSLGLSEDQTSPLNTAAVILFNSMRRANAYTPKYDVADLMTYVGAAASYYSCLEYAKFILALVSSYSIENRYLPQGICEALQIDFDEIQTNLGDFRYALDVLIRKSQMLTVPKGFAIFDKWKEQFNHLYIDGASLKDQLYVFKPHLVLTWKRNPAEAYSSSMQYEYFYKFREGAVKIDHNDIIKRLTEMLELFLYDEDLNTMSGDIMRYVGTDNLVTVDFVDPTRRVDPEFDPIVLMQIQNATLVSDSVPVQFCYKQDVTHPERGLIGGWYADRPTEESQKTTFWDMRAECRKRDNLITVPTSQVTPELLMEITRYTTVPTNSKLAGDHIVYATGASVLNNAQYWYFKSLPDGRLAARTFAMDSNMMMADGDATEWPQDAARGRRELLATTMFSYWPITYVYEVDLSGSIPHARLANVVGNISNFSLVPCSQIAKMHSVAMISLLYGEIIPNAPFKG